MIALDQQLLARYLDPEPEPRGPGPEPRKPEPPKPPAPASEPRSVIGRIGRFFGSMFGQSADQRSSRRYQRELADYYSRRDRYYRLFGEWTRRYDSWRRRVAAIRGNHTRKLNAYRRSGARMRVHVGGYFRDQWLPPHRFQHIDAAVLRTVIQLWEEDARQVAADTLFEEFLHAYSMQNVEQWTAEAIVDELLLKPAH